MARLAQSIRPLLVSSALAFALACDQSSDAPDAPPPGDSADASGVGAPAAMSPGERVARDAYARFQQGWQTGNFDAYLALLRRDDFEFSFPVGEFRGLARGPEGYARMVRKLAADASGGVRLQLSEPFHVASDGRTTVFEFESRGRIGELDYQARNAIALEVEGAEVVGFREYLGDIDPRLFGPSGP